MDDDDGDDDNGDNSDDDEGYSSTTFAICNVNRSLLKYIVLKIELEINCEKN